MAMTSDKGSNKIERREFLKKTGAGMIVAGFPGIISAQCVTYAI